MPFLSLPTEIRENIYQQLYGSIVLHPCTIPSSRHEISYPPDARTPSARMWLQKTPHPNLSLKNKHGWFITAYTNLAFHDRIRNKAVLQKKGWQDNSHTGIFRGGIDGMVGIPVSSLISLQLVNRRLYFETRYLLHRVRFGGICLDLYGITDLDRKPSLIPYWLQNQLEYFESVDLNVREDTADIGSFRYLPVPEAVPQRGGLIRGWQRSGYELALTCAVPLHLTLDRSIEILIETERFLPKVRKIRVLAWETIQGDISRNELNPKWDNILEDLDMVERQGRDAEVEIRYIRKCSMLRKPRF